MTSEFEALVENARVRAAACLNHCVATVCKRPITYAEESRLLCAVNVSCDVYLYGNAVIDG